MHPIITAKLDDLKALCTKHRVATLEVFGSILRDDFGPDSDVDLIKRSVIERSENFIRRRAILSNTETVYRAA